MAADAAIKSFQKSNGNQLPRDWEPLCPLSPKQAFTLAHGSDGRPFDGIPARAFLFERPEPEQNDETPLSQLQPDSGPSDSDKDAILSSSSSGDSSGVSTNAAPADNISWVQSSGANGRLHLLDGSDLCCGRRRLFRAVPGHGLHLASATGAQWSPRCRAKLPPSALAWWTDSFITDMPE